ARELPPRRRFRPLSSRATVDGRPIPADRRKDLLMDIRRIVLIQPYRDGRLFGKARGSPYTLMRLASLVPDEIPVEIWDENLGPVDYSTIGPNDLVGITTMSFTVDRTEEISRAVRRRGATVVVGGTHATLMPEHTARFA